MKLLLKHSDLLIIYLVALYKSSFSLIFRPKQRWLITTFSTFWTPLWTSYLCGFVILFLPSTSTIISSFSGSFHSPCFPMSVSKAADFTLCTFLPVQSGAHPPFSSKCYHFAMFMPNVCVLLDRYYSLTLT